MSHPPPFPQQSLSSSSPLPQHMAAAAATNGAYYASAAPQPAPVLSAPGSLAPATSASSSASSTQSQPPPPPPPQQPMWSAASHYAAAYPAQQPAPPHHQQQQPQQQPQHQSPQLASQLQQPLYPPLHSQAALSTAGRLASNDSAAPTAYAPQVASMSASPAYSPVSFLATQQQPQPAQHARFQSTSPPAHSAHSTQQTPQQPHHQQPHHQQHQQQQHQHQHQQQQQQPSQQQPHPQQASLQAAHMQPAMLYNQFGLQHHPSQHFNGHQPHTVASYTQPAAAPFSTLRMQQFPSHSQQPPQPQPQPQLQQQHSTGLDRQVSSGSVAVGSPHAQQLQPPSSPRLSAGQFMGSYPAGGQMGSMHGMSLMQHQQHQQQQQQQQHQQQHSAQQQAASFYPSYITAALSSTSLAPSQPAGVPQLNYAQSMPVSVAASGMSSAVVMASTASAPSTYTAAHHQRNKAGRHNPLASTAGGTADPRATARDNEASGESTDGDSPGDKLTSTPPRSKFPRSACSHPPFQLLKTESKRPYATLLYTANKRMLPSFLAKKQALFGQEQPPPADSPDMVTIKVRVMALHSIPPPHLPPLSSLYFVAADISAIIHSRKSNIAKAVSSFPDDEKKRASVLCAQQNGTVSTHSLTVLSWKGVERLLNFSCAPVALPFLEWLRCEVQKLSSADAPSSLCPSGSAGYSEKVANGHAGDHGSAAQGDDNADSVHANGATATNTTVSAPPAESAEDNKLLNPHSAASNPPPLKIE